MKTVKHPDPNITSASTPLPGDSAGVPGRETHERNAVLARMGDRTPLVVDRGHANPVTGLAGYQVFTALAENVRDYAVFLMDRDGIIRFWGEGARLMKWWTREQMEGTHLRALYLDGGSEDGTAEDHLQTAAATGEYTGEGQRVRQDGSTFWAGVTLTALKDSNGELVGFAKVTRDFSARRAIEAALRAGQEAVKGQRLAEEAHRLKTIFIAGVSNEIRTPLNAMITLLQRLEGESPHRQEHTARILAIGKQLTNVVEDILNISELETGSLGIISTAARLRDAIKRALSDVQPDASAKGVTIINSVSGTAAETPYWGDAVRVEQIISHLLSNAVESSPSGSEITISGGTVERTKQAHLLGPGPWIYVRVEDRGAGLPANQLETIFEPFEETRLAAGRVSDALGLGVSRRIARLMGGDLTVQSQMGAGSVFMLFLPVAEMGPEPR